MGKQLKSADILGLIEAPDTAPGENSPATTDTTPIADGAGQGGLPDDPTPEFDIMDLKEKAEEAARGKPSAYQADLRAKLRDQVQFNFGTIPRFIYEGYAARAKAMGMNKREYLYHLLRQDGVDIPPYNEMDGRKL